MTATEKGKSHTVPERALKSLTYSLALLMTSGRYMQHLLASALTSIAAVHAKRGQCVAW
jgi:hypothetical protein